LGGPADTDGEAGEVRKRIFRLIKNSLTLGFILIFLSLLRPQLVSLIGFTAEGLTISGDLILNVIDLLFVVYFGYFILVDVKYFLDLASARFGRKDRGKLQSITYDIAGLISLVLASSLVTPILTSIQGIGETTAKVVNIILLAIGFFIVYHLANQIYSLLKQQVEKLIHETRQFRTSDQTRKSEGQST
jgi:predicted PurR-regulated permease PerM